MLIENGKGFTDRLGRAAQRNPIGMHEFDPLCAEPGIEHRIVPPQYRQTNGIPLGDCPQSSAGQRVERLNGRVEEVLQLHHVLQREEMETTLRRHAALNNQKLPQSALGRWTPLQATKDWHDLKSQLFMKQPCCLTGCDT